MKKYSIIMATLIFAFFVSCSSGSKSQNDFDIIPDADSDGNDAETIDKDADSQDSDSMEEDDEFADGDTDSESNDLDSDTDSGKPDKDYDFETSDDPYCEAFSFSDYNIAYHYYADKPTTANDPENIKDLWSKNCVLSKCDECEPKPYDLCAENYPFEPQIIDDSKNYVGQKTTAAGKFQCDALLTPGFWQSNDLAISMVFNELDGKVLLMLDHTNLSWQSGGAYVYDLNTRKIERLGRGYLDGWQNKKYYFFTTFDYKIDSSHQDSSYYGPKNRHLLFYDKETYTYGKAFKMDETPTEILDVRANDTYIFASIHFKRDASDMRIMYTKIGEWDKWKELTYKKETLYGNDRRAGYPSMIGSLVTYFDYDIQVQICDLNVGDSSCFQVSRNDEYGRYPIFKDKNTIIYSSQKKGVDGRSLVEADISDKNNIKYRTIYELSSLTGIQAADFEGDMMLLLRMYNKDDVKTKDACFYNYKTKKVICMDEDFDLEFQKDEGFLYKNFYVFRSYQDVLVRDLECYCDFYPEKCPLIDYTPNPDNPKEPWKRECGK